jgi:hypothetical protein
VAHVLESFAGLPQENLILEAKPQTFILSRTQGQGAQLVYRTCARGPSPTELARCVASRGHYVDLSGDNQNTLTLPSGRQIQVNISDAEELVFSLGDSLPVQESEAWKLHALLEDGLACGEVLPLPHLTVTWRQIGEGFTALSEGIGPMLASLSASPQTWLRHEQMHRDTYLRTCKPQGIWLGKRAVLYEVTYGIWT